MRASNNIRKGSAGKLPSIAMDNPTDMTNNVPIVRWIISVNLNNRPEILKLNLGLL